LACKLRNSGFVCELHSTTSCRRRYGYHQSETVPGVMNNSRSEHQAALPPFPHGCRTSGVLLHVTSLPSPYGIGDLGPAAVAWVDRLHDAGQRWWQALPLGPTGCGNSPYSCLSSFAGNSLLVSPDLLIEDGLLSPCDCEDGRRLPKNAVDFDAVIVTDGIFAVLCNALGI
jgi:hypothetical protein